MQCSTSDTPCGRENAAAGGVRELRRFIELHGGRLWVDSEPGKGSTFTFALPYMVTARG